jgi:hypothetical protein
LDLFTGPVGSANVAQQIHDYNPHIDSNDVFWTIPLESDAVEVDFDDGRARLSVTGQEVFDDHDVANSLTSGLGLPGDLGFPYPFIAPVMPVRATVSFELEWSGPADAAEIDNKAQGFKGKFLQTGATIKWSATQDGFRFQSEPPESSMNLFAVLGRELNGVFAR